MIDIDEQLRTCGEQWRARQPAPVVDVDRATASRPRRRSTAIVVTVALVAAAVVGSLVLVLRDSSGPGPRGVRVEASTSSTPAAVVPHLASVIELGPEITQVQTFDAAAGKIWVTGDAPNGGAAHVEELDAATGQMLGDTVLPDNGPFAVVIDGDTVWVRAQQGESSTHLYAIDAATHTIVKTIEMIKDGGLAVTPGAVWAADGIGNLLRIDPASGKTIATIPLHTFAVIYPALGVSAGPLGLWVTNGYDGSVQRVDTTTNTAGPALTVGSSVGSAVQLGAAIWFARDHDVVEVTTNGRKGRAIDLGEKIEGMTTDGTSLWIATISTHVLRVDPATGVVTKVALPPGTAIAPTIGADATTGAVWVAATVPSPRLTLVSPGDATVVSR